LIAWVFLTLGIALGSWWAYYELGWGGWWFWDPVENASFMPWLVGTALIHSLAVTEKRSAFKNWTVLLAILTFSLSLLGTFLVRSGVLTSVHAFATDPERGVFILLFLGIVIGISLILYAWRAPSVGSGGNFSLISLETFLLTNNILLVVACASVLLGTLYPLFLDALGLGKISVGPPYFDTVFYIIMAPLMFLLGFAGITRWKKDSVKQLMRMTWITLIVSLILGFAIPFIFIGMRGLIVFPTIAVAIWIAFTGLQGVHKKLAGKPNKISAFINLPLGFHGMSIAHAGVAICIIGIALTNAYSIEKDVRVAPDEPLAIGDYNFIFKGTTPVKGPNYNGDRGLFIIEKNGQVITKLEPEKRLYIVQRMPMTEAAIDWGLTRDIYVALGEPLGGDSDAWSARIYYKPFVRWIWIGALLMALGGLLAASDRRYRRMTKQATKTQPMATPATV